MARLKAGDACPEFIGVGHKGEAVTLRALRGRAVLLAFFRYASCPLCNLRVQELRRRSEELGREGLSIIAVFQSSAESLARYAGRQAPEFPLVGDPEQTEYWRWGVERSWLGFSLSGLRDLAAGLRAMGRGFWPGAVDGPMERMPADFLIGPDGRVVEAYYGKSAGDHLPVARMLEALAAMRGGAKEAGRG